MKPENSTNFSTLHLFIRNCHFDNFRIIQVFLVTFHQNICKKVWLVLFPFISFLRVIYQTVIYSKFSKAKRIKCKLIVNNSSFENISTIFS